MSISLGVHVGQQNMTMDEMRALHRSREHEPRWWRRPFGEQYGDKDEY